MAFSPDVCLEDLCPVCGDQVSGYHYGLLTCESCKGFFKRTVQNNKAYVCVEYQQCTIDKAQRKRCPFCRFQKCLTVGMRLEAVRADRMRGGRNKFGPMYKRDRALKQQRRALIQGGGFRTDSAPPLLSLNPYRDWSFPGDLQPAPILHSTASFTAREYLSLQPPSLSSLLPPISPDAPQLHSTPSSSWTIKSEPSSSTSPPGSSSELFPDQLYPLSPQLELELLRGGPDEIYLQEKISARLLQEQAGWGGHWTPSTFSLMCVMADQTLLCMVEWALTSVFFKQLQVSDQMRLLHSCWSELLLLDVVCRQVLFGGAGRLLLVTGEEIDLSDVSSHAGPSLCALVHRGQQLVQKLHVLKVDHREFSCMKFLVLFNPEVKQLEQRGLVESVQTQVKGALLESTSSHLPGRFSHLLQCVCELRSVSALAEGHLYHTHLSGEPPCDSLLLEMLHAKHA